MKMVKEHIQILLRLLATQFENERKDKDFDKDFDSNIRILLHAQAIKNIQQNRTFNIRAHLQRVMKIQDPNSTAADILPVTEMDMRKLEGKLLEYAELTKQPVTLTLPVRSEETCWNSLLTTDQKEQEIFIGKCGECKTQHEYPKCDKCRTPRRHSGQCKSCHYTKPEEEPYQGYCGNCFKIHEFPNCVQCQQYRIKPGRCTNCGAVGPDNTEWIYTCLSQDDQYEELMEPILEARKIKIEEQSKRFTTYKNCPLCKGYFHSAKACIFRRHVGHVNEMQKNIQQLAEQFEDLDISGSMVLPVPTEAEEQLYSEDSSDDWRI